jgi:hypothetical protein
MAVGTASGRLDGVDAGLAVVHAGPPVVIQQGTDDSCVAALAGQVQRRQSGMGSGIDCGSYICGIKQKMSLIDSHQDGQRRRRAVVIFRPSCNRIHLAFIVFVVVVADEITVEQVLRPN